MDRPPPEDRRNRGHAAGAEGGCEDGGGDFEEGFGRPARRGQTVGRGESRTDREFKRLGNAEDDGFTTQERGGYNMPRTRAEACLGGEACPGEL